MSFRQDCVKGDIGVGMGLSLGGHLKTGHTWTLQNRPTERSQDKSIYTVPEPVPANSFSQPARPGLYWRHLDGGYGNAGMRPERRSRAGMGAVLAAPSASFWRESDKSREREGSALALKEAVFLTMRERFWCANCVGRT